MAVCADVQPRADASAFPLMLQKCFRVLIMHIACKNAFSVVTRSSFTKQQSNKIIIPTFPEITLSTQKQSNYLSAKSLIDFCLNILPRLPRESMNHLNSHTWFRDKKIHLSNLVNSKTMNMTKIPNLSFPSANDSSGTKMRRPA